MTPPNLSILLIMICFWLTLWLVNRYLIVPVQSVLDKRVSQTEGARQRWRDQKESLESATRRLEEELAEAARQAAELRARRRAEANARREESLADIRAVAAEKLEEAMTRISKEGENARVELKSRTGQLAAELAGQILGRELYQ